jgi:hypothetical protein
LRLSVAVFNTTRRTQFLIDVMIWYLGILRVIYIVFHRLLKNINTYIHILVLYTMNIMIERIKWHLKMVSQTIQLDRFLKRSNLFLSFRMFVFRRFSVVLLRSSSWFR